MKNEVAKKDANERLKKILPYSTPPMNMKKLMMKKLKRLLDLNSIMIEIFLPFTQTFVSMLCLTAYHGMNTHSNHVNLIRF